MLLGNSAFYKLVGDTALTVDLLDASFHHGVVSDGPASTSNRRMMAGMAVACAADPVRQA